MRTISAAEANRQFSKLLRDVKEGESVAITSHGQPVAMMAPFAGGEEAEKLNARSALLRRLERQKPMGIGWSRDELYDGLEG